MKKSFKLVSLILSCAMAVTCLGSFLSADVNAYVNPSNTVFELDPSNYSLINYTVLDTSSMTGIQGFVARLYKIALGRDYDQTGFDLWCNTIATGEMNGANVARSFLTSDEFINKGYTYEQFLTILYNVFFNREPDTAGYNNWINYVYNGGHSRYDAMEGFINSQEWANVCIQYGITSGSNTVPTISVSPSNSQISFVTRLYTYVLGRSPDASGLADWSSKLASLKLGGKDVASGFFFSQEFRNKFNTLSVTDKITVFYNTFLDRGADETGLANWTTYLNNGGTLEGLFDGFVYSTEFKNLCAQYNIVMTIPSNTPITYASGISVVTASGIATVYGHYDNVMAQEIVDQVNAQRVANGLSALTLDTSLVASARIRSCEVCYSFSHQRPNGSSCFSLGSDINGENIAAGQRTSTAMMNAWMNSQGHRENILRSTFTRIGVAVFVEDGSKSDTINKYHYGYYGVQLFGC